MISSRTTHRRGFLGRMAAAAGVAAGLPWVKPAAAQQSGPDDWLAAQTGAHRCFFDFPAHKDGSPLWHIYNYVRTYTGAAYGESGSQVKTVGTFYSIGPTSSIPLAFNDKIWSDYALGEYMGITDPQTRQPSTRNLFNRPQTGDPIMLAPGIPTVVGAGIENLQKMGTTFLLCNNALVGWTLGLADAGKGPAKDIERDLRANILPGVVTVPAMVIAIEKAQEAGISYNKQ